MEKKDKTKFPFAALRKGAIGLAMAGMMAFTPFMTGCSGAPGEQGEKGDRGETGLPGATWYHGEDDPLNSTGVFGDYYFETDTGNIWFRGMAEWSIVSNIRGVSGTKWYADLGVPSASVGVEGDFYLDKDTFRIYQKMSGEWTFMTYIVTPSEEMHYYDSLATAISVATSKDFSDTDAMCDIEEAVAKVYEDSKGVYHVVLMQDITITEGVTVNGDVVINMSGHKITYVGNNAVTIEGGDVTIDASTKNGGIYVTNEETSATTIINVLGGKCTLIGGKYENLSNACGTKESPNPAMMVRNGARLYVSGSDIHAEDETTGTVAAIQVLKGGKLYSKDAHIFAEAPYALSVTALRNEGEVELEDTDLIAYANYTANEAKNDYASDSRGMINKSTAILRYCHVQGAHSGITNQGQLLIDGGIYEGYGHGGIYFSNADITSYVKNATIRQCSFPGADKYYDDGIAGTNQSGMYVGGANNVTIYMDNCTFRGAYYPLVMKSKCTGNNLYISNSNIGDEHSRYIRLDVEGNKLHIGLGNDFDVEDTATESYAELTGENYYLEFPNF